MSSPDSKVPQTGMETGTTASMPMSLVSAAAWSNLFLRLTGKAPPKDLFSRLSAAYAAPDRHYHTLDHVGLCLEELATIRDSLEFPDECSFALWFHDAVYDTHAGDNEEKSAAWAVRELSAVAHLPASIERIRELILDTAHRHPPSTLDGACLVDCDLAILGQTHERFKAYENAIRREYSWVPAERYRTGRTAILRGFLARPRLFLTDRFTAQYEFQARANLTWAIDQLERLPDVSITVPDRSPC